jgi:hypothetical protein
LGSDEEEKKVRFCLCLAPYGALFIGSMIVTFMAIMAGHL